MKINIQGKQHFKGTSKKTGNDYDFIQIHYLGEAQGVIGKAALTLSLDPQHYNFEEIQIGKDYTVEFDRRGYVVGFSLIR